MTDVKRTGDMHFPLEEPNGWHLYSASHEHTLEGDKHMVPVQDDTGPWIVFFGRSTYPFKKVIGRGRSLAEAWVKATLRAHQES